MMLHLDTCIITESNKNLVKQVGRLIWRWMHLERTRQVEVSGALNTERETWRERDRERGKERQG